MECVSVLGEKALGHVCLQFYLCMRLNVLILSGSKIKLWPLPRPLLLKFQRVKFKCLVKINLLSLTALTGSNEGGR